MRRPGDIEPMVVAMDAKPVFLPDGRIVGYLDVSEIPRAREPFRLFVREPMSALPSAVPGATIEMRHVLFRWDTRVSRRGEKDLRPELGNYLAYVLVVDDGAGHLGGIRGFHWFAEYHGDHVREPGWSR
jgi:hypothetical protein